MPDVVSNDELNALAAEYVLGTLDYEERKGASALLEVDPMFRGIVRIWERRFGELHLMVEAVDPDPQLWLRIKPKMAGVEQIAPAIPSHAEEQAVAPAVLAAEAAPAAAPATAPAAEAAATEPKATEPKAAEPKADAAAAVGATTPPASETAPAQAAPAEATSAEAKSAEAKSAEAEPAEAKPTETKPAEAKPAEVKPPAVAEAELKLAELAALLPVAYQGGATQGAATAAAEPVVEDGLHTHAPDLVPRGFVPPAPMSTRGTPAVVEKTIHKQGGRGWVAATLAMALIAVALAGLISAWRFFPEQLPPQLRANTVLNLTTEAKPAPKPERPKLTPFDE
jgi:anti-sigma-K factor RskA